MAHNKSAFGGPLACVPSPHSTGSVVVVAGPRWEYVFFMLATVHAGQTQLRPRALQPLSLLSNLPPFHPPIIAVQASWSANRLRFPYGTIAAAQVDGY